MKLILQLLLFVVDLIMDLATLVLSVVVFVLLAPVVLFKWYVGRK